jgi:hypothetical protein
MLAIKMNNIDSINVLCDHEAEVRHKAFDGDISPLEYALNTSKLTILNILVTSIKKQKLTHWENNKTNILKTIKKLPDFTLELKFNFDSNILNIFTSLTPNNCYKVYIIYLDI